MKFFTLLSSRRFLPLFFTQFLGAFNDNVFKNALVILITFRIGAESGLAPGLLITLAAGLFILPFLLFSATAGQWADSREKAGLIQRIKTAEIAIMALAGPGLAWGNVWFLLLVLFLMGSQSAFFGPLKYGILPDHLDQEDLLAANAWVELGTFLAILTGTILGGLVVLTPQGLLWTSLLVFVIAILGRLAAGKIPPAPARMPGLKVDWNLWRANAQIWKDSRKDPLLFAAILAISWFWFLGASLLSQFPSLAKEVLGGDEEVVTLFLTAFSLGIGLGSLACGRWAKQGQAGKWVGAGALGMSLALLDLAWVCYQLPPFAGPWLDLPAFLAKTGSLRILGDLFLVSCSGGVFILPLYTLLQSRAQPEQRARVIAGNNLMNAIFMVASALILMGLLATGVTLPQILAVLGVVNLPAGGLAWVWYQKT